MKTALEATGVTVNVYTFSDSNDVAAVPPPPAMKTTRFTSPPTTLLPAAPRPQQRGPAAGVPIIAGEEGICKGCGIATLSIDYYELGRTTGEMAVNPHRRGRHRHHAIEYYANPVKEYDADRAAASGRHHSQRLHRHRSLSCLTC